jgi:ribose 5-phosphate isomerase B
LLAYWITSLINLKKIFISSDHAGYNLKEAIKFYLDKKKYKYTDLGPNNNKRVDYPIYAHKLAKKVKIDKNHVGILICGSGIGMNIAANRHKNIRAALCFNLKSTKLSRLHNDANIITLGSRLLKKKNVLNYVNVFLNTKFESGRHLKRIKKI